MSEFEYEIGDEFESDYGTYRKIEHRMKSMDGAEWYWCSSRKGEPTTYPTVQMNDWTKIEPFFKVGDTFRGSHFRYEVKAVECDMKAAWVKVISIDGETYMESVGVTTWGRVKDEVLRNRSN